MDFSFSYLNSDNQIKRVSFNAKETEIKVNYSELTRNANRNIRWEGTGENRFLTNSQQVGIYVSDLAQGESRAAIESLFNFAAGGANILSMDSHTDWHDSFGSIQGYSQGNALTIPNTFGKSLFAVDNGVYRKVCTFQWFTYLDQRHVYPQESGPVDVSFNGGLMYFQVPGVNNAVYTPSEAFLYPTFSQLYPPKLAMYIITIKDDVQSSATYNQEFKCLIQCHSYQQYQSGSSTTSIPARFTITDLRLIDKTVTPEEAKVPNGSDPKQNSNPKGWSGNRNTRSASDVVTTPAVALESTVNFGEHGIFLYKIDSFNLGEVAKSLWAEGLIDKFKDVIYSPSSGVLAVHMLPYRIDGDAGSHKVQLCGTTASYTIEHIEQVVGSQVPRVTIESGTAVAQWAYAAQSYCSDPILVEPFFNSFLDFEPYTKIQVRMPFIGIVPIPTSAVMGGAIRINYIMDNRNGNVVGQIYASSMRNMEIPDANGEILIGQWSGNCKLPMALTGNSMGSQDVIGAIKGFASNAVGSLIQGAEEKEKTIAGGLIQAGVNAGLDIITARHEPRMFGTLDAGVGPLTDLSCRIIITRPVDVTPGTYKTVNGTKVFNADGLLEQKGLASYSGGTVSQYRDVTQGYVLGNINGATEGEIKEIRRLFAEGVNIKG